MTKEGEKMNKNEIIKNLWNIYNGIWTDIAVGLYDEGHNGYMEFVRDYQRSEDFNLLLSQLCKIKEKTECSYCDASINSELDRI